MGRTSNFRAACRRPLQADGFAPGTSRGSSLGALAAVLAATLSVGCKFGQATGFGTAKAPEILREHSGGGLDYGARPERRGEETAAHFEGRLERHYYTRYERLLDLYERAPGPGPRAERRQALERHRDRVLFEVLAEIDDDYFQFEKQLTVAEGASNVIWDWIDIGLDATAAAITPVSTKTILSTIAVGVEGARLSVDKNAFRQQTHELIRLSMRAERQGILNEIYLRLERDRADDEFRYSLEEVLRDLARYYYAGSVGAALDRMHRLATNELDWLESQGTAIRTGEFARAEAERRAREAAEADRRAAYSRARASAELGLRTVLDRLDSL